MSQPFFDILEKIDAVIANGPTNVEFSRDLQPYLVEKTAKEYFYNSLKDPDWLDLLTRSGEFRDVPEPQKDPEKESTVSQPWPQSRYLARMASAEPNKVLEIASQIADTKNIHVWDDLIDMALAMPADLAAKLSREATAWMESRRLVLLPEKLGALISHLARGGEIAAALDLARNVLAISAGKDIRLDLPAGTSQSRLDPEGKFDSWYYGEILKKNVPDLTNAAGTKAFDLLCDLLDTGVKLRRPESEAQKPQDYSYIWRRAIEDHSQNQSLGVLGLLISAVRDAAEQIAKSDAAEVPELVGMLEKREWYVFQRLSLHILRLFPDNAFHLIVERLTNRQFFGPSALRHEYVLLLRSQFAKLGPENQATILEWIEDGPNLDIFLENRRELGQPEPSSEEKRKYLRGWQLDRLAPLREVLNTEWKNRYDDLLHEFREPEHPEFASFSKSWVGPTSPKNFDELSSMTVAELVMFLKDWESSEDHWNPTPEGLGRVLADVIAAEPEKYATESHQFKGTQPTYVRSVLSGLGNGIAQKRVFSWPPVLELCNWVLEQPRESATKPSRNLERDPHWGWARKTIAELLTKGFGDDAASISFNLRETAWNILKQITNDPEPDQKYEEEYGGSNMDPATMSINTTRGEAMHTVVRYGLWVRRHIEKGENAENRLSRGFDEMPEVREVLDEHLNLQVDASLAIRSIYGQWYPWLLLLDPPWTRSKTPAIFSMESSLKPYFDAAWNTYVMFCPPYDNVLHELDAIYVRAVENLSKQTDAKSRSHDSENSLAEHLITYYWRGKVTLDENGLLVRFWQKANDQLRAHAIEFAGRSLSNTNEHIPPEIAARFKELWAARLGTAKASANIADFQEELAAFGWWFIARKLGYEWELAQLKEVLLLAHKIDPDSMVVERLVELADKSPMDVVESLRILVETTEKPWGIYGWGDEAKTILATIIESPDEQAREEAIKLIHRLGSMGHLQFRELLGTH